MKNRILLLLLLLPNLIFGQSSGRAWEPVAWAKADNVYYGRVERNYAAYPYPSGDGAFYAAIGNGTLPFQARTGPAWAAARVTYLESRKYLEVEVQSGANVQLKFERVDGVALSGSNADCFCQLQSGVFYGNGNTGLSDYSKIWAFGMSGNAGGIPSVPIRLTLKNNDNNTTYTHVFKPLNRASRAQLFIASGSSPPPTNPVVNTAANIPSFDTFDYTPITSNLNTWPSFDSRTDNFGRVVGEYYQLSNGQINVRIHKRHGASPTHISGPDGVNKINLHDLGTMNGQVLYRGGRTSPNPNAQIDLQWARPDGSYDTSPQGGGVGNDPIQHGDVFGNSSEVVASGYNGTTHYAKVLMKNWAVNNETTDCILEQWVHLDGRGVHIHTKLTNNRVDDQIFYEARAQEWPCLYSRLAYRKMKYVGPGGSIVTDQTTALTDVGTTKPWVALENVFDSNDAIGLWAPGLYFTTRWEKSLQEGGDEFQNGAGYTANRAFFHTAWNDVIYSHHAFIVGNVSQIQAYADALADPRNTFVWKFNTRNGRGHWQLKGGYDTGFPTPETGLNITKTQSSLQIYSPYVAVPASSVQNIVVRMALTGGSTEHRLFFEKTGQQEIDALQAGQTINFTTTNDGQYRTYTIPVSQNGGWTGTISRIKLLENNSGGAGNTKIAWINYVNAEPTN